MKGAKKSTTEMAASEPIETKPGSAHQIASGAVIRSMGRSLQRRHRFSSTSRWPGGSATVALGTLTFGLSFSAVLFTVAAFGTDDLVTRELSRDHSRARHLLGNVVALKVVIGLGLLGVVAAVVEIQGYAISTSVAIVVIAFGVGIETITKTFYSVFQAYERMRIHLRLLDSERTSVAILGIVVVLDGGNLLGVAVVFAGGAALGLASAIFYLHQRLGWPEWDVDRSRWVTVIKAGIPIGLVTILYVSLIKLDISLLSFLKQGNNTLKSGTTAQLTG